MTDPVTPLQVPREDAELIRGCMEAHKRLLLALAGEDALADLKQVRAALSALSRAQPAGQGEALEQAYIALEFYANRRSYEAQPSEDSASGFEDPAVFTDDYGALARETLRAIDAALNAQSQGGPRG